MNLLTSLAVVYKNLFSLS